MRSNEAVREAARCVPGSGPLSISRLKGGLVNETYRVVRDGVDYALRIAGADTFDLGLDREWESRVLAVAAAEGLAPPVIFRDSSQRVLLSQWIQGEFWTPDAVRRPTNVAAVADLARRIHALPIPQPARTMSPGKWIEHYGAVLARVCAPTEGFSGALATAAAAQLARLALLPPVQAVLCHSDLHALNLLSGRSLVLLDWEYAHAADPLWDVAAWSCNNDFDEGLRLQLLTNYEGREPTPEERLRLELLCGLFDYVCLLWGKLYLRLHGAAGAGDLERIQALETRLRSLPQ